MKTKQIIKSLITGAILFEMEAEALREAVIKAVEQRAYLRDADLSDA